MLSPKEMLRGEIKQRLKDVPREEFRSQGIKAAALLRSSPLWARFKTVFLFLSMKSEIDTQPMLEAALKDGKRAFAPRVEPVDRIVFYPLLSAEGPWRKGPFGIREPVSCTEPAGPEDFPALILAPGLAFDREGKRLGRGKGYYDRFFAKLDAKQWQYTALGLCMDFQVLDQVPAGEKDKKMDGLLTGNLLF